MNETIPVLEIFGPTIQGEGLVIGQKTMFVRTAGCDYSCSWCDSAFTWDGSAKDEIRHMTPADIYEELITIGGSSFAHVTLSGGNPALYKSVGGLISLLHEKKIKVAVETQGSKWQEWFYDIDDMTLSPKPPSSGMLTDWNGLDDIVCRLRKRGKGMCLKIVIFDEVDLEYAIGMHKMFSDVTMVLQVGNHDISSTGSRSLIYSLLSRYEWLINRVMSSQELKQVRILPQLHTLIWGNQRGV
jgi:7-carboxy-7-deazaguanine synthase